MDIKAWNKIWVKIDIIKIKMELFYLELCDNDEYHLHV